MPPTRTTPGCPRIRVWLNSSSRRCCGRPCSCVTDWCRRSCCTRCSISCFFRFRCSSSTHRARRCNGHWSSPRRWSRPRSCSLAARRRGRSRNCLPTCGTAPGSRSPPPLTRRSAKSWPAPSRRTPRACSRYCRCSGWPGSPRGFISARCAPMCRRSKSIERKRLRSPMPRSSRRAQTSVRTGVVSRWYDWRPRKACSVYGTASCGAKRVRRPTGR